MGNDSLNGKLAVILHADVVGSTALVQRDETLAHRRIQETFRHFAETIDRHITHEYPRSSVTYRRKNGCTNNNAAATAATVVPYHRRATTTSAATAVAAPTTENTRRAASPLPRYRQNHSAT